jgi:pyridoxamine 5'-phosphate oxidase family protein
MSFTEAELSYLRSQLLGRLATQQPNGTLQVNPVAFVVNDDGTLDIGGHRMEASRKFRNVAANGRAALVVDDVLSTDPWQVRCLEIRGSAATVPRPEGSPAVGIGDLIRITPNWVRSYGLDEPPSL